MKISRETWIRTILTATALFNSVITMCGKNPLPWSEEEIYIGLSAIASFLTTLWSWWKNNSFTKAAIKADLFMAREKHNNVKINKNGIISENQSMKLYDYESVKGIDCDVEYPKEFTIERTADIKNQGKVGACCACAMATIAEYIWKCEFSEGWNYGTFREHKGAGLYVQKALELWKKIGSVPTADFGLLAEMPEMKELVEKYPELFDIAKRYQIKGYSAIHYADLKKRDVAVKTALTRENVALLAICPDYFGERHAVVIDGWNDEKNTYTIQNSWGEKWGDGGFGEIPKNEVCEIYSIHTEPISLPFSDVDEDRWSYKPIRHMYLNGLMNGTTTTTFEPEKSMSREEMAAVMERFCEKVDDRLKRIYQVINNVEE